MLYDTLKADRIQAMKDRDQVKKDLLGTLVGQVDLDASKPGLKHEPKSDLHCIALIKKFLDDNRYTQSMVTDEAETARLKREAEVLNSYMPKQLTAEELRTVIVDEFGCPVRGGTLKGEVMKFLKANYGGNYDGKLAAQVHDELANS